METTDNSSNDNSSSDNLYRYFNELENIIHKKTELLKLNHYNGAENIRLRDRELLTELESIYGILKILNERLSKIEE
jgi:hypothetical protein